MNAVITEADLFFSDHPRMLLQQYSSGQLEVWFGPSARPTDDLDQYITLLLNDLWRKYRRVDLVKWDPDAESPFFDYETQKLLSLKEFWDNFDNYSMMSLRRLQMCLEKSYQRWVESGAGQNAEPFRQILDRIVKKERRVLTDAIVDNELQ